MYSTLKYFVLITLLALILTNCHPDLNVKNSADTTSLFQQLKTCDSLLFNIGFNECNLTVFDTLVADDFEFYHDQSGITPNKEAFLSGTKHGFFKIAFC